MSFVALHRRLQDWVWGMKFFVVLDDVWTMKEWDRLKASFTHCARGSGVLVTTRNMKIANSISYRAPYPLGTLNNEHCWDLFKAAAFGVVYHVVTDGNLERIGIKIVEKCKGVPLAVKVVGAVLQGSGEERWETMLKNEIWRSVDEDEEDSFPVLRMSYHYLSTPLKRCFEYLSIFPTDYQFDKDELVRKWIAEDFVEAKQGRLLEDIGSEYYEELQRRTLLQPDNKRHDLVHSLACIVSRNNYCRLTNGAQSISRSNMRIENIRHVSFISFVVENRETVNMIRLIDGAKCLRTLMLFQSDGHALMGSLPNWGLLRVVELIASNLFELPSCIGDLKHLRYVNLSLNKRLHSLPDRLCELHHLQAPKLYGRENAAVLPNDMGNLQNLRYLNLS